jgi:DNA-directed RNA polymerase subunit F
VQKRKDNFESKSENQQEQELMRYEKVLDQMIEILGETAGEKLRKIISTPGSEESKIKELTDAIVPICDRYNKTEEQNYSLFKFVNEISSDVKRMKSKQANFTSKTKSEATKITDTVNSCDNAVKLLNEHVKHHTSQEQAVQKALNELNNTYNLQKNNIKKLFDNLSCSKTEIESMLENSSNEISESSLDLYLSSIEETINDIVHRHLSNIDLDRESDSRKSRNRVTVSQQQKTRKTSKDSGATKKPKTAGLNDSPNISVDFLDQHFDDLDKIPLDSTALKERAKYLITEKERARNVQSANSARKTPKTPSTRKASLDSKNRKIRI